MHDTIFEGDGVRVQFDPHDADLPYGVDAGLDSVWLDDEAIDAIVAHRAEQRGERTESGPRASEVSFNEGIMRLAAVHGKTVRFRYSKGDGGVIEERRLTPEQVFTNKQGDVLFGGQDPDRDEYRAYRVDRIKGEVTVG